MSYLHEAVIHAAGGGGDVFSTINNWSASTQKTAAIVGGAVATLLVLIGAWRSKGALAGVISAFVVGLLIVFAVSNVGNSNLQDKVKNTVNNGAPGPASSPDRAYRA